MDGTVALFDAASGKLLHTLDGHFKPVRDLCFTPGGWACMKFRVWEIGRHFARVSLHMLSG